MFKGGNLDTVDKIYNAVQSIATEENIHTLTITDIANASKLARKTIYSYFKSKEEILLEMYAESLNKRYYLAELGLKNLQNMSDRLYRTAQVSFNYYKKDTVSLLIHVYWSNLKIDLKKINPEIRAKFITANNHAHEFVNKLFASIPGKEERDFYSICYLDSIHTIIRRAILEPEFWTYKSGAEEYFEHSVNIFLKGLQNEIKGT